MKWELVARFGAHQTRPSVAMDVVDGVVACVLCDGAPASEESFDIARDTASALVRWVARCGPSSGPEATVALRDAANSAIEHGSADLGYHAAFSFIGVAIDGMRARFVWIGHVGGIIEHGSGPDVALPHVVMASATREGRIQQTPMTTRSLPVFDLQDHTVNLVTPRSITLFNGSISYKITSSRLNIQTHQDVVSVYESVAAALPVPGMIALFPVSP